MTDPSAWASVASQGGFAVLAAFMGWLSYQVWQQAMVMLNRTLDTLTAVSAATATFAASIAGLQAEIAGLRADVHRRRDD